MIGDLTRKHEGESLMPYPDPLNPAIITIGIGRNLTANGIRRDEMEFMFQMDMEEATDDLNIIFPDFDTFSNNRQEALIDMRHNLGSARFREFHNTIQSIKDGNWVGAANGIRLSLWHTQLPGRVDEDAKLLEEG